MTTTLISLISIIVGILAANVYGNFNKKHSFDIVGNSIAGVFGSIFFIKLFGHFGISPFIIMKTGNTNYILLILNLLISISGAIIALILIKKLKNRAS